MKVMNNYYQNCRLCPRGCSVNRYLNKGFCGCTAQLKAARAGLHYFEEPFISGDYDDRKHGSGTVFFSGCNLRCIFCQNHDISGEKFFGIEITADRLAEVFLELQAQGAHNINLVTGTPYIPHIAAALKKVRSDASYLHIPVVWNSSGYESIEALEQLEGLVDIWLPDLKTLSPVLGERYMHAADYPEAAKNALSWMVKHSGHALFADDEKSDTTDQVYLSEHTLMKSGVCVRHLVMPGEAEDSKAVLKYLYETFGNSIWISLMSQYTPMRHDFTYPELNRKLTSEEYDEVVDYALELGIEQCMIQDGDVADESFIPVFDGTGI